MVDYIVDEALVTVLCDMVTPSDGDVEFWDERLRYLFDYEDAGELFDYEDAEAVVRGISTLRVLDPAVGSGAFPMAVLNKLTLALRRLDPENDLWQSLQKETATKRSNVAYEVVDQHARDDELLDISETFERYSGDFGRKLYLIQNSIFGADVQPIASQIAKLRFFISLAIEQEPDPNADNLGIRPLPNLETRFVTADTLLELSRRTSLSSSIAQHLKGRLLANREKHFHAKTRSAKLACMKEDRRLRTRLARELNELGFPSDAANQISQWDPYDQNAVATWFDSEYMFGVNGFHVVVGNPPYIQLQKDGGKLGKRYKGSGYQTYERTGDIYQLFFEKGCRLLRSRGVLAYITSNSWLRAKYGKSLRKYFHRNHTPLKLLNVGKDVFDAVVDASVLILRKDGSARPFPGVDTDTAEDSDLPPQPQHWGEVRPNGTASWGILSSIEWRIMEKIKERGIPLKEWGDISIYRGVTTGCNKAFIVGDTLRSRLIAEDPKSSEVLKPILRGTDIQRYRAEWAGLWLIAAHNGYGDVPRVHVEDYPAIKQHLDGFFSRLATRADKGTTPYNLRNCAYHAKFTLPKLLWNELGGGRFAYDDAGTLIANTAFMMTGPEMLFLCGIMNSKIVHWFIGNSATTSGMGALRWLKIHTQQVPIPDISTTAKLPVIQLVKDVLEGRWGASDTSAIEARVSQS